MAMKSEFIISSLLPVQGHISTVRGTKTELNEGSELSSHEISNYFDEIVAKKNGKTFNFTWNPADKYKSTFTSIKANPKAKESKKFKLAFSARLVEDGKLVWSRQLDLKNAFVKDAGPDARMGGQFVDLDYESATPSKEVHH